MQCWKIHTDIFGVIGVIKNCSVDKFMAYVQYLTDKGVNVIRIEGL